VFDADHVRLERIAGKLAAGAMFNLGILLEGQGRADQAEHWYRNSAVLGHSAAMTRLGSLIASHGNAEQAAYWYRKAAATGDTRAMRELGNPGEQGDPELG
jgi:TPR repeat protein